MFVAGALVIPQHLRFYQLTCQGEGRGVSVMNSFVAQDAIAKAADEQSATLDLSGLQLTTLPPEIGQLTELQQLRLVGNQLTTLPPEIGQLAGLQQLRLVGNQLTALPPEIGQLINLRELWLDQNQLRSLPPEIGQLVNLRDLWIDDNELTTLPRQIGQLVNLTALTLVGNRLGALPADIGHLVKLQELRLDDNMLTGLPSEVGNLTHLEQLWINDNRLTSLPPEVGQLARLEGLYVVGNQLTALPREIGRLANLKQLKLKGNQFDPELAAAVHTGIDELQAYLVRLAEEGERLYEAKLLFVGEGAVGKSSLLGALRGDPWVENRDSTHGLDIKGLTFEHPNVSVKLTLQGWDFGGQPVYRPTHQLFFSAPGLYLVVWKPREGAELNFVEYWIRLIKHRAGPGARVVVVATHRSEGRVARVDEPALRATYGEMIAGFHHVDSLSGAGIADLRATIAAEASQLPAMGRWFPRSWRKAREMLKSTAAPFLSYGTFEATVASAGLDQESAASFALNCHELGHLIHYADDPGLAHLVVLRPDWLSRAMSYVLEDQMTVDNKGLIAHARLAVLWHDNDRPAEERYDPLVHPSLLRLMEHFDLSYRVESFGPTRSVETTSLIAQLVPTTATLGGAWDSRVTEGWNELTEVIEIVETGTLRSANAEGLVFQLIVRLHRLSLGRHNYRDAVHWSGGLVLEDGFNGRALLTVTGSRVQVTVRGAYPQFLMGQLIGEIRWLVDTFWKGLSVIVKVPCGHPCGNPGAGVFDVEDLQRMRERNHAETLCPSCKLWQPIDSLLLGVVLEADATRFGSQLQDLQQELRSLRQNELVALRSDLSNGFQRLLSRGDELFERYLRTLDSEAENGPRLFTLVPVDRKWTRPGWIKQRFRLTLYCEHSHLPVSVLSGAPNAGLYVVDITREWVEKAAPLANVIATLLSVGLPAARALGQVELGAARWTKLQTEIDNAKDVLSALATSLEDGLGEKSSDRAKAVVGRITPELLYSESDMRQLHDLLRTLDIGYGGLEKVRNSRREPMWVHPRYLSVYRPSPPAIPQPRRRSSSP